MSESPSNNFSKKEYTGEKINLSKEALEKIIVQIKTIDKAEVAEKLKDYIDFRPGIDKGKGTFEMMALYQRALQLLGSDISVDALFGGNTLTTLKATQEKELGFSGKDIDGLPGPKTTAALIKALQKEPADLSKEVSNDKTEEKEKPAETKSPKNGEKIPVEKKQIEKEEYTKRLQIAKKYLESLKYTENDDGTYTGPDKDLIITIRDYGVDYSRLTGNVIQRALWNWKLSVSEIRTISELRRILNGRSGRITGLDTSKENE